MKHRQGRRGPLMTTLAAVAVMSLTVPAVALAGPGAVPVQAAPTITTDFFSSFEAADPQPAWTNTVETDVNGRKKASGIVGSNFGGIPGNVTDEVVAVAASGENTGGGEVKENLVDGDVGTKWLVFQPTGWVRFELAEPVAVVRYALSSANDAPTRDPRDWTLQGSQDGQVWTTLDTRLGEVFTERLQTKVYEVANTTAYRFYRLEVTANSGASILQLAEVQLSDGVDRTAGDPRSWVLKGSNDGRTWAVLDERHGETFQWRRQTRVFKAARQGEYAFYRIEVTDNGGQPSTVLAEVELLD
jgi:F5/8 type C domain